MASGETPENWRDVVISEYDYSARPQCDELDLAPRDARLFMVFDGRFKLIHAEGGFRPMFFDLANDPEEFIDLGQDAGYRVKINRLYDHLTQWGRRLSQRITRSDADIIAMRGRSARCGVLPFLETGDEVPSELTAKYRGPARQSFVQNEAGADD